MKALFKITKQANQGNINNIKIFSILTTIVMLIFLVVGINKASTKMTYLEYSDFNDSNAQFIQLNSTNDVLEQDFIMPYDIFHGIAVKIGTFARDNNSLWDVCIYERDTGKIVAKKNFNASLIIDNSVHLFEFDKNYRVKKNKTYTFKITPTKVNEGTSLAFWCTENFSIGEDTTRINGVNYSGNVCIKIYGSEKDNWWIGIYIVLWTIAIVGIYRFIYIISQKKKVIEDKVLMAIIVILMTYFAMKSFCGAIGFLDEYDNMRGGMVIAKGGVLYRDYVTQHTPVTYYLCSTFALLGAGSVEQFRLSYYLFQGIIWALLYIRNENSIGKVKMFILPMVECIFVSSIIYPQGCQILSDGIQGLCMVALLLEFYSYYKEMTLDWKRSIIISICLWGSFGAAFVSAYALMWIVFVVLGLEIKYWIGNKISFGRFIQRYYKFFISIFLPLLCAVVYFKINGSLRRAFEQFYTFNRIVYPQYTGDFGKNPFQPIIEAIKNYFNIISASFNAMITAEADNTVIIQFVIAVFATVIIILMMMSKRYIEAFVTFMIMSCSATRGYGFHGIAAWFVAIMVIVIFVDNINIKYNKFSICILSVTGIFMVSIYVNIVSDNLLRKQVEISELDAQIEKLTSDNEDVFVDAWTDDTLYLCYKNRFPANRVNYILPWYMDWYESDCVEDLINKKPNIVIYNEKIEVWGQTYFSNEVLNYLEDNYIRWADDINEGWKYYIWEKRDN